MEVSDQLHAPAALPQGKIPYNIFGTIVYGTILYIGDVWQPTANVSENVSERKARHAMRHVLAAKLDVTVTINFVQLEAGAES
jgi:hypothetical protein